MCESNVHAFVKPSRSARRVSSTMRLAGGSVWNVTPKSIGSAVLVTGPGEGAPRELVQCAYGQLEVGCRRVLLLRVADAAEALDEQHHGRHHARHLGGVVQRPAREPVARLGGLPDRLVGELDQL